MLQLPQIVQTVMTSMFNNDMKHQVPLDVMLPEGKNLFHGIDRDKACKEGEAMENVFRGAGCLRGGLDRQLKWLKTVACPVQKVNYFTNYLRNSMRQVKAMTLDGSLHSMSVRKANEYIDIGDQTVCGDLQVLVGDIMDSALERNSDHRQEKINSPAYWQRGQPSGVQHYTYWYHFIMMDYNRSFFNLMPQNLFIANQVQVSSISYAMGDSNHGLTWLGHMCAIIDGGLKFRCSRCSHATFAPAAACQNSSYNLQMVKLLDK